MPAQSDHFIKQVPPELQPVMAAAIDCFTLSDMSIHGPSHWLKVLRNATQLVGQTPHADMQICQHFALLHDCHRRNESTDPQHGPRAATYATTLHNNGILKLTKPQLMVLCEACTYHADGRVSDDSTIGVCWDADRLDLPRVGIGIDRKYLSTAAARRSP
jgi:uncharacterized protein